MYVIKQFRIERLLHLNDPFMFPENCKHICLLLIDNSPNGINTISTV